MKSRREMFMVRKVYISDFAVYLPEKYLSSMDISRLTGIPEKVIKEKFGLNGKHIASSDEHTSDMALKAARKIVDPSIAKRLDLVIYFGSQHKDYYMWLAATRIQHELGASKAAAFELYATSCTLPFALKVAHDIISSDEQINTILLVGASVESRLLNYRNERSRFMINFADGAAAALVQAGSGCCRIMQSAFITDGSFNDYVKVPAGGSVNPPSEETVRNGLHRFDVTDPVGLKKNLDPITSDNFNRVIRESLRKSGYDVNDISLLLPLHVKYSLHRQILSKLSLEEERSIYLRDTGHVAAMDGLISLALAREKEILHKGDVLVITSAGTGFTWGATTLVWSNG
ncbi:MAG: 3-oxoacyl-ACP synthase [Conexivisphaerales archaeon]